MENFVTKMELESKLNTLKTELETERRQRQQEAENKQREKEREQARENSRRLERKADRLMVGWLAFMIRLGVGMWLNILIAGCAEKTAQDFNQKLENKIQKEIEKGSKNE